MNTEALRNEYRAIRAATCKAAGITVQTFESKVRHIAHEECDGEECSPVIWVRSARIFQSEVSQ